MTFAEAAGHVRAGRHSNFPTCCIAFYVLAWDRANPERGWRPLWAWVLDATAPLAGYVRCPACVLRRRVARVHYCTSACA